MGKNKKVIRSALLVIVALVLACPSALADTILYSTVASVFGSDSWKTHADPEQQISVAMPFTVGGSRAELLKKIELGFSFDPTGEDFVQIDVFSPLDGHPGPSLFGTFYDLPFVATPDHLLTVAANVTLPPGKYFLGLQTTGDIVGTWAETTAPFFGGWTSTNGGSWIEQPMRPTGVFRLSGTHAPTAVTPEPASLLGVATGLAAALLRTRRTAARIEGSSRR